MRHTSHVPASEFLCAPQACEFNCVGLFSVSHDPSEETKKSRNVIFINDKTVIFVETDAFFPAFFDEYKVEKNGIYLKYNS